MTTELIVVKDEKYLLFIDEIQNTITEAVHNSRWMLVEGYWLVGQLIRENFGKETAITTQLQGLAVDTKQSEKTLWNALRVYDFYPSLDLIPEGKNISMNKLLTKYLPKHIEVDGVKPKHSYADLCEMVKAIKELLQTEYAIADVDRERNGDARRLFIRHLQEQVSKITEGSR